jgi:endo-1,4-beta-D-glucanase Y
MRRPRSRRILAASVLAALAIVATACGSASAHHVALSPVATTDTAPGEATVFLHRYVDADGRVVRIDQGGDTVSEGQAYALLLDVATDRRAQFATVWNWSKANLMQPDGLLAYHWQAGRVVDRDPASDADLDIARALVLAGSRWHDRTFGSEGRTYAQAILTNETMTLDGRLWLVAGPWARTSPYYLDPSYFDPGSFALLGSATHDPSWSRLAASSAVAVAEDTAGGTRLPSDWATVSTSGQVQSSAPPTGGATVYGYDAFRTLVRQTDACTSGPVRRLDAKLLPLAARTASAADRADDYNPDGTPSETGDNPLMLVAAAGAAAAAGDDRARDAYLDQAAGLEKSDGSYYFDAWVALGRYLLTTSILSGCNQ